MNFQMFKLDLEKAEKPEIKFPTSVGSYLLIATGESIPLLCVEGVPGLPGAPQDDASVKEPDC